MTRCFGWILTVLASSDALLLHSIRYQPRTGIVRLWSTTTTTNNHNHNHNHNNNNKERLAAALTQLGIDATHLAHCVESNSHEEFGPSAIRACRSFWKTDNNASNPDSIAQQIDFLVKRHRAQQTAWIRNHHDHRNTTTNKRFPVTLVLDNLRSAYNVGSIFRTADAANLKQILTVGITPHQHSGLDKLQKSALGAELTVPTHHFATTSQALDYLRSNNVTILGLETTDYSSRYTDYHYPQDKDVALILGNEVTGVDPKILRQLDGILEIPMFGHKNSLNVASCAPIVVYEILRQRQFQAPSQ